MNSFSDELYPLDTDAKMSEEKVGREAEVPIKSTESVDQPPPYETGPKAQPAVSPQPTYVVAQAGLPAQLYPHSYLTFSTFVSAFCGLFNILTFFCTLPAVKLSLLSVESSKQGLYSRGKIYGNTSAGLTLGALVFGMVATLIIPTALMIVLSCNITGSSLARIFC